jgi:hypothetical protein
MRENKERRVSRAFVVTAAAAVIAVFALLLTVALAPIGAPASSQSGARVAVVGDTTIYLNRSQGTAPYSTTENYVGEFVSLNNSSTLTRIPTTLTVAASSCKWVAVENLSTTVDTFDSVLYVNVTSGNATGTSVVAGTFAAPATLSAFKACGGSAYYVNYAAQAYHVYNFAAPTLTIRTNATLSKATYPGATTSTKATEYAIAAKGTLSLKIPAHESFDLSFLAVVDGPTSCDVTGQICSYPTATFVSATNGANVTASPDLTFFAANSTASAYSNWTLEYKSGTASANTPIGGFFADSRSAFVSYVVDLWYVWIVALLVVAVILLARDDRPRRR